MTADISARVPLAKSGDELDELGLVLNGMLDRIENLFKGMQSALDNVAHDLRTPMTSLRGAADLALQKENDSEAYRSALQDCLENSDQILTMLNTLMDISEAQAGTMKLQKEQLRLSPLVEDVVDLYSFVAEEKGILLENKVTASFLVHADKQKLRQALANLLDNSIKYTPRGGIVEIWAEAEPKSGTKIHIRDTGSGIPDSEKQKIWEKLYRGDQSRSERGFGLGLSLVKAIVNAHGWIISVESKLGKGSTFTIEIPH